MHINKTNGVTGLVAIALMVAGLLVLAADYRAEVANHRAVMLARGETALDALAAGIRAQGRMGRYRGDRLSFIFEELAAAPDMIGVALYAADGTLISSGGQTAELGDMGGNMIRWTPQALLVRRVTELDMGGGGGGRGRGAGRFDAEGFAPLPAGPHQLVIALDTRAMETEIRGDRVRLMAASGGALVTVFLGTLVFAGWLRRRRLDTALTIAREQAVHQQQLTLLGAGLAHETKNPLSVVRGHAQLIAESPEDAEENRVRAERIVDEIDRTVGHINGFLALSRPRDMQLSPVNLGAFLETFASLMEEEARQKNVRLAVQSSDVVVRADEGRLRKALLNLVLNALQACEPGDRIDIEVMPRDGCIDLSVHDTGRGIAPEDLSRVTEPYFTRTETGCGLGLSLVQQIAQGHGWRLDIQSKLGEGTSVSLRGLERVR